MDKAAENFFFNIYDEPRRINTKASEEYVHVFFAYPGTPAKLERYKEWDGWIPVRYRRQGIDIPARDVETLFNHVKRIYDNMRPEIRDKWLTEQDAFWNATRSVETKKIFNILKDGLWHCRNCDIDNPNFARRIQDLKEMGYTISTRLNYHCPVCGNKRSTRLLLLPVPRVEIAGNGYETWPPELRARIIHVLGSIDAYENVKSRYCLPDHKFPEIRWDENTKTENPAMMPEQAIRNKFQLLSNQRNLQKREVCRRCFQTGERGVLFGIPFFYEGGPRWDSSIPTRGKSAERGCVGCPWHDIARWREELVKALNSNR